MMRFLLLMFLVMGVSFAAEGKQLRVAVFLPDAPVLGKPQLESMAKRFESELQEFANDLELHFVSLDSMVGYEENNDALECHEFECALRYSRINQVDLFMISRIDRNGRGHRFEGVVVSTHKGVSIARTESDIGASLGEFENRRPGVLSVLGAAMQKSVVERGILSQRSVDLQKGTVLFETVLSGKLTRDKSPYLVYGAILVPASEELVIESGVTVYFVPGLNGGLTVFGQLSVQGEPHQPVRFLSASLKPEAWDWRGLLIGGLGRTQIQHAEIAHANTAVHIENSGAALQNVWLHDNSVQGIYVRNAQLELSDSRIESGSVVGILAGTLSSVRAVRTRIQNVGNAVSVLTGAQVDLNAVELSSNDRALVIMDKSTLLTENCRIENNLVGISGVNKLYSSDFSGLRNNGSDIQLISAQSLESVLQEPRSGEVIRATHLLANQDFKVGDQKESTQWSHYGNVQAGIGYTKVLTSSNPGPLQVELTNDTVMPKTLFPNEFTPEGIWGTGSLFWVLESSTGLGIEVSGELRSDSWVRANANPLSMRIWSPAQSFSIGHVQEGSSPLFLSGLELLGLHYTLTQESFRVDAFAGESREPFGEGDRDPDMFAQEYDSLGAVSQQLLAGGRLQWNPTARWGFSVAGLIADDRREDLWVRDAIPSKNDLQNPLSKSKAAIFGLEWRNASRSISIVTELAVGQADTADVLLQQALDQVLAEDGLASIPLYQASRGDSASLAQVFDLTELSLVEAKDSLEGYLEDARVLKSQAQADSSEDRIGNLEINRNHLAARLEVQWMGEKSSLSLQAQSIGKGYASLGVPSLAQNYREYSLQYTYSPVHFWDLEASYSVQVENASGDEEDSANLLGFGEGTTAGLLANESWQEDHLMDVGRAKFTHEMDFVQRFRLGSHVDLNASYSLTMSRQSLPKALTADMGSDAAVALDPWFAPSSESTIGQLTVIGNDTVLVDADKWSDYADLSAQDSIAWGFMDRRDLHSLSIEMQWRRGGYALRMGATLQIQLDQSQFAYDDLANIEFSDTTLEKLGYHPATQTWWEHSYPITLTSSLWGISQRASFKPRFKQWVRNDAKEYESNLTERLEIPFWKNRLQLNLEGSLTRRILSEKSAIYFFEDSLGHRYDYYRLGENGETQPVESPLASDLEPSGGEEPVDGYWLSREQETVEEKQWEASLELGLRINWSSRFYSELKGFVPQSFYPGNESEEFKQMEGSLQVYYAF